jgi:hypothetical protein
MRYRPEFSSTHSDSFSNISGIKSPWPVESIAKRAHYSDLPRNSLSIFELVWIVLASQLTPIKHFLLAVDLHRRR